MSDLPDQDSGREQNQAAAGEQDHVTDFFPDFNTLVNCIIEHVYY